jgi:hypothetical protein
VAPYDGRDKHSYYPAYTEATAETQRHRQSHPRPEHHHQDNHYGPYKHEYPKHSKSHNPWADQGSKWDCMGTCQAGKCHVSPYDLEQCVGGY